MKVFFIFLLIACCIGCTKPLPESEGDALKTKALAGTDSIGKSWFVNFLTIHNQNDTIPGYDSVQYFKSFPSSLIFQPNGTLLLSDSLRSFLQFPAPSRWELQDGILKFAATSTINWKVIKYYYDPVASPLYLSTTLFHKAASGERRTAYLYLGSNIIR